MLSSPGKLCQHQLPTDAGLEQPLRVWKGESRTGMESGKRDSLKRKSFTQLKRGSRQADAPSEESVATASACDVCPQRPPVAVQSSPAPPQPHPAACQQPTSSIPVLEKTTANGSVRDSRVDFQRVAACWRHSCFAVTCFLLHIFCLFFARLYFPAPLPTLRFGR